MVQRDCPVNRALSHPTCVWPNIRLNRESRLSGYPGVTYLEWHAAVDTVTADWEAEEMLDVIDAICDTIAVQTMLDHGAWTSGDTSADIACPMYPAG